MTPGLLPERMAVAFGCSHATGTPGEVACKDEFVEGMCRIREKRRTRSGRPPKSDCIASTETSVRAIRGENAICCVHLTESCGILFDLVLMFCKEHLYSLCRPSPLPLRSLKHQPSRLNFNTVSVKGYKMVAHNFCQNPVKYFFSAFNGFDKLYNFLPK
jgi:hypothetical protein